MSKNDQRFVVIATYDERENIASLIAGILELNPLFQVLVVDDNSPDGTGEIVAGIAEQDDRVHLLARPGKKGYGTAVMDGFREVVRLGGGRVFTMDADHSHDPRDLQSLDRSLDTNDVVIGSRYREGIRILNWGFGRLILSLGANIYVRLILRLSYADCTSGFRGYREEAVRNLLRGSVDSCGYSFLVEVLDLVRRAGFIIGEVPIVYTERRAGKSKMARAGIWEAVYRPWLLQFRALVNKASGRRQAPGT